MEIKKTSPMRIFFHYGFAAGGLTLYGGQV
jgi:hypothetical protein